MSDPFEDYLPLDEICLMKGYDPVVDYPNQDFIGSSIFFWSPREEKNGFDFVVVEPVSEDHNGNKVFAHILSGIAYFDGVRHIWFSYNKDKEANGYINYPDIENIALIFNKVSELERIYCRE